MPNVSDFLIHRLTEWGVDRIYGYPGDGINGIMGALGRAGDDGTAVRAGAARGDGGVHGVRARQVHGDVRAYAWQRPGRARSIS